MTVNCYQHPDRPAASYCRTCGRPLCTEDQREVYGVVYCQPCLAQRLGQAVPGAPRPVLPESHSPGVALLLGFIPGVGAVYNNQYFKAFMQVVIFAFLIFLANHSDNDSLGALAGLFIAAFYFYMVIDSYTTARAIAQGRSVEDPFAVGPSAMNAPWSAIVLIAIGIVLFLDRLGWFMFDFGRYLWPILLIACGFYLIARGPRGRRRRYEPPITPVPPPGTVYPPPGAPYTPPPADPSASPYEPEGRPSDRL